MIKQKLIYTCAVCGKQVHHPSGPHWLDDGTELFCPECGGVTVVHLSRKEETQIGHLPIEVKTSWTQ